MSLVQYIKGGQKFFILVTGLYICSLLSALNHQRLLKQPFRNIQTGEMEYLQNVFIITFTSHLVTAIVGRIILFVTNKQKVLPWKDCLACGTVINIGSYGYNSAIIKTSFPAVVMVKSCSLLSVVLVGVLCSRVRDKKLKLGKQKIGVGVMACIGIFCFNYGANLNNQSYNQPISLFSVGTIFLLISLLGDGFLPDFQAKIKSQNQPTSIQLYYAVNIYTAGVSLILLIIKWELVSSILWFLKHEGALGTLLLISILNSITQLFVYEMIKEYRQHVPAFVIATRKCITVLLSLFWYHHSIGGLQYLGIGSVFISIFLQVYTNYVNSQKQIEQGGGNRGEQRHILAQQQLGQQLSEEGEQIEGLSDVSEEQI